MDHYQVAVVGAGPAGSAAVLSFKKKNKQVVLIDRAVFPRDKVCGDGIPLKTFNLLQQLGFEEAELFRHGFKINRMRVYSPDNDETVFGDLKPDASTKSGCIPRLFFDNVLYERAAASADRVLTGYKLTGLDVEKGRKILRLRNTADKDQVSISCDLLVGADGANSFVARLSGLLKFDEHHLFDGLRIYYEGGPFEAAVHLVYDARTLPGYVWIFPVSESRANVGLIVNRQTKKRSGKSIKQIFYEVLETNEALKNVLRNARPQDEVHGAPLLLGTLPGSRIADHTILIGDAAAFINPVTGGGIYFAVLSAMKAAETGSRALDSGNVCASALEDYEKWWRKEIRPGFNYSEWLRRRLISEKFTRWFFKRTSKNRLFANFFIMTYGRPLPGGVFYNPLFWIKLILSKY